MTPLHVVCGLAAICGIQKHKSIVGYINNDLLGNTGVTTDQRVHFYQTHYQDLMGKFPMDVELAPRDKRATNLAKQYFWAYLQEGATSQKAMAEALKIFKENRGKNPQAKAALENMGKIDDMVASSVGSLSSFHEANQARRSHHRIDRGETLDQWGNSLSDAAHRAGHGFQRAGHGIAEGAQRAGQGIARGATKAAQSAKSFYENTPERRDARHQRMGARIAKGLEGYQQGFQQEMVSGAVTQAMVMRRAKKMGGKEAKKVAKILQEEGLPAAIQYVVEMSGKFRR